MSMIGMFLRVTDAELEEYIKDSSLLENRIYNDEDENEDPNLLDIDKSWDALSFLITEHVPSEINQAPPPLAWLIFGAQVLDENQDFGYGPANYLTTDQVTELNDALKNFSSALLRQRYNYVKMNELKIYPGSWYDSESEVEYLLTHFNNLQGFYQQAATNRQAVITYLS